MKTEWEKIDWRKFDYSKLEEFILKESFAYQLSMPLYHYTNLEALINILKTKTLWATNCEYTNDLLELKEFERMIENFIESEDELLKGYATIYKNSYQETLQAIRSRTYILSFTVDNDSIAMWKNYGKSGIVIEFDISLMMEKLMQPETDIFDKENNKKTILCRKQCSNAIYDDDEIRKMIRNSYNLFQLIHEHGDIVAGMGIKGEDIVDKIQDLVLQSLHGAYFTKKDSNFSYEKEVRISFVLEEDAVGNVENFKVRNNLIVPYIAVDFSKNNYLPIKSITINPENKECMYESGIKHLLKTYNYDIPIKLSKSKVR